jgi:hypothetical protein
MREARRRRMRPRFAELVSEGFPVRHAMGSDLGVENCSASRGKEKLCTLVLPVVQ